MRGKLTQEEYIKKAREVHCDKYDYSKTIYINSSSKIIVTCPIHGDFEVPAGHHIRSKSGCRKCSGNYHMTTQEFIERSNQVHDYKYDYSKTEYKNKKSKVCIICPEHGEFWQRAEDHYSGHGCRKCFDKQFAENQTFDKSVFLNRAIEKFGNKYVYDLTNYETLNSKIKIVCPEHGTFEQIARTHLQTEGCPRCGRIKANNSSASTTEEFVKKCIDKYGDKFDYSKTIYTRLNKSITVICKEHGEFIVKAASHLYQGGCCPHCILKSQTKLFEKLKQAFPNEIFLWGYRAKWLGKQRIDICLEKYQIAIEYDGKQHFEPVELFGGEETFKLQLESDSLKNKKCKENGFALFRLRYDYTDEDFYEVCLKINEIILQYNERNNSKN